MINFTNLMNLRHCHPILQFAAGKTISKWVLRASSIAARRFWCFFINMATGFRPGFPLLRIDWREVSELAARKEISSCDSAARK